MGKLQVNRRPSRVPQVGDMRNRISLYQRDIQAPTFGSADFTQKYTLLDTVWASITTFQGPTLFDQTDQDDIKKEVVIEFKIRYRSDVTAETIIQFGDDRYKIINPNNMDKRNRFLFIHCSLLGNKDFEVNQ